MSEINLHCFTPGLNCIPSWDPYDCLGGQTEMKFSRPLSEAFLNLFSKRKDPYSLLAKGEIASVLFFPPNW